MGNVEKISKIFILFIALFVSLAWSKNTLLIFRSVGSDFDEAVSGMRYELDSEFEIKEIVLTKQSDIKSVEEGMDLLKPNVVVLMNNRSISFYKKYQKTLSDTTNITPSVSLMGILVDESIDGIRNSTGVGYEIPLVTSAVNLRAVLNRDIRKIAVIHRSNLKNFLSINTPFCENEGVEIKSIEISTQNIEKELRSAFKAIELDSEVDAIWIPNDNKIITGPLLKSLWIPFEKKMKLPIIVGVESLVTPKYHFGNFAVVPDHIALGSQAAELVLGIMDNNWLVENTGEAELPLSVHTIVNYPDMNSYFELSKDMLSGVDRVLE
jgi:ABC-type uncharacterized transport system substrate-binding protein